MQSFQIKLIKIKRHCCQIHILSQNYTVRHHLLVVHCVVVLKSPMNCTSCLSAGCRYIILGRGTVSSPYGEQARWGHKVPTRG
jgi:hypothetical protein